MPITVFLEFLSVSITIITAVLAQLALALLSCEAHFAPGSSPICSCAMLLFDTVLDRNALKIRI